MMRMRSCSGCLKGWQRNPAGGRDPLLKMMVRTQSMKIKAKGGKNRCSADPSVTKAKWWLSISLFPSDPVNRRAAITHVLTACNGISLRWAKGCQAASCRSGKQLGDPNPSRKGWEEKRQNYKQDAQSQNRSCYQSKPDWTNKVKENVWKGVPGIEGKIIRSFKNK